MTELSRPWPGTTIGDAGPFNVGNWWDVWAALIKSGVDHGDSALYNLGVFYSIRNQLEPTDGGTTVDVDTGACLADGLYHENDAAVNVAIPAAAGGLARIDYIVVRKNYQQAVTYTPAGAGPVVGPREARITVIRGAEAVGPVAPSLVQDITRATYWDIPIATVEVSDAGALSSLTDLREWADIEEASVFAPPLVGYNAGTVTDLTVGSIVAVGNNAAPGVLTDNVNFIIALGRISIPENAILGLGVTVTPTCYEGTGGNVRAQTEVVIDAGAQASGYSNIAVGGGTDSLLTAIAVSIAGLSKTKAYSLRAYRDGAALALGGPFVFTGWKVSYWKFR